MRTSIAAFEPVHVELAQLQVHIGKLELAEFADTQSVPVHQKQQAVIANLIARHNLDRSEEFIDFVRREIFALPA